MMNTLAANFPELALLLALVLSVLCWRMIKMILTALAVGFVLLVVVGMAGYGTLHMLLH
jgi:CHASE2 domain-containing sensor protein